MAGVTSKKFKKLISIADGLFLYNGRPAREICDALGISRRELLEAMQTLSMCGVPPYDPGSLIDACIGDDGCVYATHVWGLFDRPVRLSRDEALPLLMACRASLASTMSDSEHLKSALSKIETAFRPEEAHEIKEASSRMDMSPDSANILHILGTLKKCAGHEKTKLEYYTAGRNDFAERVFQPYGLIYHVEQWYCAGHCEMRNDFRLLRVDRIKTAVPTGDQFETPETFSLEDFKKNKMFKMIERPHEIKLLFSDNASVYALEKWPEKAVSTPRGTEVVFNVDRLESFIPAVLGYGNMVSVVSPPEFTTLISDKVKKTLGRYKF